MRRFLLSLLAFVCFFVPSYAVGIFAFELPEYDVLVKKSIKPRTVAQDIDGKLSYKWETSDENIATVKSGIVKGIGTGDVIITCTASSKTGESYTASCIVHVLQPVQKITVEKSNVTMYRSQTYSPVVTIIPENASITALAWKSSKPDVVSVDSDGTLHALAVGSATITGTSTDGSKTTVKYKATVPKVYVTEEKITLTEPEPYRFGYALNAYGISGASFEENGAFVAEHVEPFLSTLHWIEITPVKAGSGKLVFRSGGEKKTVKVTIKHSAVYDDVSYPPLSIKKLLSNPEKHLNTQTNLIGICCSVVPAETIPGEILRSIVYAASGTDTIEYFAFLVDSCTAPALDSPVQVYGIVMDYIDYTSETGLKYKTPLLDSRKIVPLE